ncbi:MAG: aspartate/glutamate racemase family protein, partial [Oscillospiraceae bacterium]|nr:aspartate/glutamate racemase family protein [Oscillospiraceae bacterium]
HLEFPQDTETSGFLESDKRILMYNAIEGLAAQGVTVVGFGCQCAHKIVGELAPEVAPRLVDPVDAEGNALSVEDYARAILAADPALPAKPFKIGVIGGLGPAASVDLYDKITRFTPAATDQEHLKVAVEQNPQTPDRTVALLEGGANPTLAMYKAARHLEAAGCDVIMKGDRVIVLAAERTIRNLEDILQ